MFGGNLVGFLEILESNVVIDNTKVQKLREKIFIENPLMTSEERSRRLIRKIHTIINQELSGIDPIHIPKIRTLVLHRSIKEHSILITYSDIIECLAELNLSLEEMIDSIKNWYEQHLRGSEISLIELIDYIKVIQDLYAPIVEEEAQRVEEVIAEVIEIPGEDTFTKKKRTGLITFVSIAGLVILFTSLLPNAELEKSKDNEPESSPIIIGVPMSTISFRNIQEVLQAETIEHGYFHESINYHASLEESGIPSYLTYHKIDLIGLKNYLTSRNSILAETPYFEGILKVSEEYDIHPLLMFAITGQEQGYVSKENPNHLKIANNPFNVYNSWRKYNTDIEDSTSIAAGTVVTILRKRPAGENPFKWVNTRYAEDKNWSRGVEMIFNFLLQFEL
jgi:putative ABC transport system permease protein